jgi:hypothetical protein
LNLDLLERIFSHLDMSGDCWTWMLSVDGKGYAHISVDGAMHRVHRLVHELLIGPIPAGMYVCHGCDNPRCVRPSHLFAGTSQDNARDMWAKGRHPRMNGTRSPVLGERNHAAKLTTAQVLEIRRRIPGPRGEIPRLALLFGVGRTAIEKVAARETWTHVPPEARS